VTQPTPDAAAHAAPHALPARTLLGTAGALLGLTLVTVVTSRLDLGAFNIVLALAIAAAKAALVAAFFMHLRYERPFQTVVFVSAVFFAVVLVGAVALDSLAYQPDVRAAQAQAKARPAATGSGPAR
jgi:cytochrome c oxidase subunit 4